MEIMEAIRTRRTVREYEQNPVPMEHIRFIVEAARWAPSGWNKQARKFIVVRDPQLKTQMVEEVLKKVDEILTWPAGKRKEAWIKSRLHGITVFKGAPVAIAVLYHEYLDPIEKILIAQGFSFEERFKLKAAPVIQSVAASIQNMLLAATSLGYGTCYGTGCLIAREGIERVLGINPPWRLAAIVPVGVPKNYPKAKKRKSLQEIMEVR